MTRIVRAAVTDQTLVVAEHEHLVAHEAAGAVVSFSGVVRNHDGGREVLRLDYSAHPHAEQILFEVLAEVAAAAPGVRAVAASHRVGTLLIGDAALVAAWFWRSHHCNELADAGLWDAVTKAINGPAMLQADLRRQYSEEGAQVFA